MEVSELHHIIYFKETTFSPLLGFIALAILLLFIPLFKFYFKSRKEYASNSIAFHFFVLGFAISIVFFASLLYPINQYQQNYSIEINNNNHTLQIISGKEKSIYRDVLQNYKAIYVEDNTTIKNGKKSGSTTVSLLRKDGLMVYLGDYDTTKYNELLIKLKRLQLPIINDALDWYTAVEHNGNEVMYPLRPKLDTVFLNKLISNDDKTILLQWKMTVSRLFFKIVIGLLAMSWSFFIFQVMAKNWQRKEKFFASFVLLTLTLGFGFYILNTHQSVYQLALNKTTYTAHSQTILFGKTNNTEGDLLQAKSITMSTNPNNYGGIMINEQSVVGLSATNQLKAIANGAFDKKFKYIRTESLSVYERLILFDILQ